VPFQMVAIWLGNSARLIGTTYGHHPPRKFRGLDLRTSFVKTGDIWWCP
jgi:hypothetical protein